MSIQYQTNVQHPIDNNDNTDDDEDHHQTDHVHEFAVIMVLLIFNLVLLHCSEKEIQLRPIDC